MLRILLLLHFPNSSQALARETNAALREVELLGHLLEELLESGVPMT